MYYVEYRVIYRLVLTLQLLYKHLTKQRKSKEEPTIALSFYQYYSNYIINKRKIKLKFTLEQATKSNRGSRGIALLFP